MNEHEIRELLGDVRAGRLSRRAFVRAMVGLGLTAPLAGQMLAGAGVRPGADAPGLHALEAGRRRPAQDARVGRAGPAQSPDRGRSQGLERVRHFLRVARGVRSRGQPACRCWPRRYPALQNGGVAKDGTTVTWKLKRGVQWHDGKPFTAQDVVFNWEYAADPATGSPWFGVYKNVKQIEALDSHTVKCVFTQPTPYWLTTGMLIPRHIFEPYKGAKSREAPNNLKPVGTGPYRFVDFKPGDLLKAEINPDYHVANRPFFDTLEVKGGGDAVSAARAVLQTGEYDYASEIGNVEDDVLQRLEQGGKGKVAIAFGGRITHVQLNQSDPWTEVDGERSSVKSVHPFLTDPAVNGALALLVDRAAIQEQILGRLGQVAPNFDQLPRALPLEEHPVGVQHRQGQRSSSTPADGSGAPTVSARRTASASRCCSRPSPTRRPRGSRPSSSRPPGKAGIEMELKSVVASSYYSSDPANPDTYTHFYADLQLMTYLMGPPDPERLMRVFTSADVASKENNWQRFNVWRFRNEEYDRLYKQAETEVDPVKRAALFIRMNDLVVQSGIVIPIALTRQGVGRVEAAAGGRAQSLRGRLLEPALLVPRRLARGQETPRALYPEQHSEAVSRGTVRLGHLTVRGEMTAG